MDKIPIVLLAAGGSTRMGQAKQLLSWGKTTLIEFQVNKLLQIGHPLYVVLGSDAEKIVPVIKNYPLEIVINPDWKTGMGSSIAVGIKNVLEDFPFSKAVLFSLIDQPMVSAAHFQKLISIFKAGRKQIIASNSENGWLGVPTLFDGCYFEELKNLSSEQGAKTIIKKNRSKVISVDAGDMLEDMDSPESYRRLLEKFNKK